jgi:hypothetical protein
VDEIEDDEDDDHARSSGVWPRWRVCRGYRCGTAVREPLFYCPGCCRKAAEREARVNGPEGFRPAREYRVVTAGGEFRGVERVGG